MTLELVLHHLTVSSGAMMQAALLAHGRTGRLDKADIPEHAKTSSNNQQEILGLSMHKLWRIVRVIRTIDHS